eukprot:63405-Amphidinium_carterae.1
MAVGDLKPSTQDLAPPIHLLASGATKIRTVPPLRPCVEAPPLDLRVQEQPPVPLAPSQVPNQVRKKMNPYP